MGEQVRVCLTGLERRHLTLYRFLRRTGWPRHEANFVVLGAAIEADPVHVLACLADSLRVSQEEQT